MKNIQVKKYFFLCFVFLSAVSCSDKNKIPKNILPKEKMQTVLWDMISAGEFLNDYVLNKDSVDKVAESSKIYGQVFQVNHITREEFDKSYTYYRQHPGLMKSILDSLNVRQAPSAPPPGQGIDTLRRQRRDTLIKQRRDSVKRKILPPKKA